MTTTPTGDGDGDGDGDTTTGDARLADDDHLIAHASGQVRVPLATTIEA